MDGRRRRAIALLVASCFFMENLDGTIIVISAPAIGRDLGVGSAAVGIAVTAFMLAAAVFIPVSGWLTDRFGVRAVFATAIAMFTIASLACALSVSLPMLVCMRVLQGIGGALMVPVGRLAVLRVTPTEGIITAIAILVWPGLVAPIVAPFLGGLLTTYASWHWIFLINVPLGAIAFVLALRIVPDIEAPAAAPLDVVGLVLVAVGLGVLVWGSSLVSQSGVDVVGLVAAISVGLAITALAVRHLLRVDAPLVQLRTFRFESFRIANLGGAIYCATIIAVPFLLPLLFQDAFGWSAVEAGTVVLALFAGNLAIKPATTWMLRTFGFRAVLVAAIAVGIACMVAMAFLERSVPIALVVALLVVSGAARSTGFTAYSTITFADIEQHEMTPATVLSSTVQRLASGFGVAVGGMALAIGFAFGPGVVPYRFAFLVLAAVTLIPLVEAARLSRTAGETLTRRA